MAKTMYTIEMDFRNANRQADELEQVAQSLQMLANQNFQLCLAEVAASWKGENAAAFCKKGNAVRDNMVNSSMDLKKAATTIRRIAQNTYQAEKRSYEIAQGRSYR